MFWVYAIYNQDKDKIYIGQTSNWKNRLKEHNDPSCNKHNYTKNIGVGWKIIYKEQVKPEKRRLLEKGN